MSLEEEQARQRAAEGHSASAAHGTSSRPEAIEGQSTALLADGSHPAATSLPATDSIATASASELQPGRSLIPPGTRAVGDAGDDEESESEDSMLKQALALSQKQAVDEDTQMSGVEQPQSEGTAQSSVDAVGQAQIASSATAADDEEMTEEEAIARAIEMSLQDEGNGQG